MDKNHPARKSNTNTLTFRQEKNSVGRHLVADSLHKHFGSPNNPPRLCNAFQSPTKIIQNILFFLYFKLKLNTVQTIFVLFFPTYKK